MPAEAIRSIRPSAGRCLTQSGMPFDPDDEFLVGDFDGYDLQDLFVYNVSDCKMPHFANR
jgi:hypothetical protein